LFGPGDNLEALAQYYDINSIPAIQIMTVIPGFQGSPFQQKELNKIDWLRENGYRNTIFIDGGVNDKTIPIILSRKNRPDFAGIGSFLTKTPNIKDHVEYLANVLR
jgi:pentose-5-phosphate-3-epimerase